MTSSTENKNVFLVGAGGHARAVYGLLQSNEYVVLGFYDDHFVSGEKIGNALASGKINQIFDENNLVLACGDNLQRENYFNQFQKNILVKNIIHSSAIIFDQVNLGKSNLIFAGVIMNSFSSIGDNNILNTGCIIEHEVKMGSHNHISLNAVLAGRVQIGNRCFIGAGSIIKDGVKLVDDIIIGAGAVVIKDISESGTYVGIPAKKIK
jgi:UDP-N-acetylbacillosamine N-acetyltransferase